MQRLIILAIALLTLSACQTPSKNITQAEPAEKNGVYGSIGISTGVSSKNQTIGVSGSIGN